MGRRAHDRAFLDNGIVRVGVDRAYGGAITHLSRAGDDAANLVNLFDMGRQVQQSYYSGPQPFGSPHPDWPDWPWNPIGAGDVYGNASEVLLEEVTPSGLHVRTRPLQWALDGVFGECVFDTQVGLQGSVVHVRCRLENDRPDRAQYPARHQELPAVYTVGALHRLVTYTGDHPFTGDEISVITNSGPPWEYWTATEGWAALVGEDGWGVGVVHPGAHDFIGGFHGQPGVGGPLDPSTGYAAPLRTEVLDHDIVYEYEYYLVLGDTEAIRAEAHARQVPSPRVFDLSGGRQHWYPVDATDFPAVSGRALAPTGPAPAYLSPSLWWPAQDVTTVEVVMPPGQAIPDGLRLAWTGRDGERSTTGEAEPGDVRTDAVSFRPKWTGTVTGISLQWRTGPWEVARVDARS